MRVFCRRSPLRIVLTAILSASAAVVIAADVPGSRADADQLVRKAQLIAVNGLAQKPQARRTTVTEREVNAYLAVYGRNEMPEGVVEPAVTIDDAGRLRGRAIVDLDAVRKSKPRSALSVWALLSGRVPVEAAGVLKTREGTGQFDLESATVGGVPVPKAVLQELVAHYTRGSENPNGIDLDAPFSLPVRIREIQTARGQAVVVQ
jgi:hypothetical protein